MGIPNEVPRCLPAKWTQKNRAQTALFYKRYTPALLSLLHMETFDKCPVAILFHIIRMTLSCMTIGKPDALAHTTGRNPCNQIIECRFFP